MNRNLDIQLVERILLNCLLSCNDFHECVDGITNCIRSQILFLSFILMYLNVFSIIYLFRIEKVGLSLATKIRYFHCYQLVTVKNYSICLKTFMNLLCIYHNYFNLMRVTILCLSIIVSMIPFTAFVQLGLCIWQLNLNKYFEKFSV